MKKILFPAICLMMTICLQAQTNFREISFDQAIAAAKAENKLVFVDVMTSWCGPCKRMASDVFPQKMVGDFMNQHFVNIKIDAEKAQKWLADGAQPTDRVKALFKEAGIIQ